MNAEHTCLIGQVKVEPNEVTNLLNKEGIVAKLERFLAVGLQGEGLQPSEHHTFGDICSSRQGARCPLRSLLSGFALQGPDDRLGHLVTHIGAGPS